MTNLITPAEDQIFAVEKFREVDSCIIGDSMGVGKTVTAIERDRWLREDYPGLAHGAPTLIICEKIGLDVWHYHLKAMGVPEEDIFVIDPKDRDLFEKSLTDAARGRIDFRKYYVIHWDVIARVKALTARRGGKGTGGKLVEFFHVIADEAHLAKNRKALRTKALKSISCQKKTACTGTPADDKPEDFWSLLNWILPGKFRAYWRYYEEFVEYETADRYIGNGRKIGYRKTIGPKNTDRLHKIIEPYYIRRTLLDINPDMPEKRHVKPPFMVDLTPTQRRVYNTMLKKSMAMIGEDLDFTLLAPAQVAVLTRLQQIALATLDVQYDSEITDAEFADTENDFPRIKLCKPSPKLDLLMNVIETHETESFVVFTQFRGMADLVETECIEKGIPVSKVTGDVPHEDRAKEVQKFQEGTTRVFVGTVACAGKTITLTAGHIVIFCDHSWNPSKNEQAEDRAWRRTQTHDVLIYSIEARDTIDQERNRRIRSKGKWVKTVVTPPKK